MFLATAAAKSDSPLPAEMPWHFPPFITNKNFELEFALSSLGLFPPADGQFLSWTSYSTTFPTLPHTFEHNLFPLFDEPTSMLQVLISPFGVIKTFCYAPLP